MQLFMVLVVAGLLVVSVIVVRTRRARAKPLPLAQSLPVGEQENSQLQTTDKEKLGMFVIEHVPVEMRRVDIGGFEVSTKVQAELLEVGLIVLKRLPTHICDFLSSPVFSSPVLSNFNKFLEQGEGLEDISSERVRVTVGVAEASLSLQDMMSWFGNKIGPPDPLVIDRYTGIITASVRIFSVEYIISRITHSTGTSHLTASEIWLCIFQILREGSVNIPGIKARPLLEGENL